MSRNNEKNLTGGRTSRMGAGEVLVFGADWALFLDVDGTLLDIAPRPDRVSINKKLLDTLAGLKTYTDGAIALISGRSIQELDRLFHPLLFCIAGLHGLERRDAEGKFHRHPMPEGTFDNTKRILAEFALDHPGIILEDKVSSIAMHFRQAPDREEVLANLIRDCMKGLEDNFHLQRGKMVFEIKPRGKDKGTAIREFMEEPPFSGRKPVFLGDDITDEDGFMIVNKLNGHTIKVGAGETAAEYFLDDTNAVQEWLTSYLSFLGARS